MYELLWAEHAAEQFNSLGPAARRAVMTAIAAIQHDPGARGVYDKKTDRYTADFTGDGVAGLIVYLVAEQRLRVVVLRVMTVDWVEPAQ